jgi:hypothetical protein
LYVWLRTGATIAPIDFLFASLLSVYGYNSTFERLWQGVASVPLGPEAIGGGTRTILIGIALHICVAFTWAGVFVVALMRSGWLQRTVAARFGVIGVAAVYGPLIWCFMSIVWIPLFTHKPPVIGVRWWIQLVGHIIFVGLPIVWMASRSFVSRAGTTDGLSP